MFGPSILTKYGDLLLDVVVLSMVIILPAILVSIRKIRSNEYKKHRNIQTGLYITLFLVILLFEYNLKMQGGIWKMTEKSQWAETFFLKSIIYIHLAFAFSTALIWTFMVISSHIKFGKNPKPLPDSYKHKKAGWIAVFLMFGTAITGILLYVFGFN